MRLQQMVKVCTQLHPLQTLFGFVKVMNNSNVANICGKLLVDSHAVAAMVHSEHMWKLVCMTRGYPIYKDIWSCLLQNDFWTNHQWHNHNCHTQQHTAYAWQCAGIMRDLYLVGCFICCLVLQTQSEITVGSEEILHTHSRRHLHCSWAYIRNYTVYLIPVCFHTTLAKSSVVHSLVCYFAV